MPDEASAAGNIGGGDDYGSFMRAYEQSQQTGRGVMSTGFVLPSISNPSAGGGAAALTSSLDRLTNKIDSLINSLDKAQFGGGGTGGGGIAGTATSGKRNGGTSIFSNPLVKWGLGAATFGAVSGANLFQNQMQTSMGIYGLTQQTAQLTPGNGQQSLNAVLNALNRPLYGATSGQDVAQAQAILGQALLSSPAQQRGNAALQYSRLFAQTGISADLTGGANTYLSLTQNAPSMWKARGLGFPGFVGLGGKQLNPYAVSMGIAQKLGGPNVNLNWWETNLGSTTTRAYQALASVYGAQNVPAINQMVVQNLKAQQNGLQGVLNPNMTPQQLQKYGVQSPIVSQMQKLGVTQQTYDIGLAMTQQQSNAAALSTMIDMKKIEKDIVTALGPAGRIVPLLSGMQKTLALILGYEAISKGTSLLGKAATTGDAALGASGGTGAAALAPLGAVAAGGIVNQLASGFTGTRNVGLGVTGSAIPTPPKKSQQPKHQSWWRSLLSGPIGDPPTNNTSDVQLVESRSNTGAQGVTGLKPALLHDVAMMMKANPRLRLNSGWRSYAQQKALYASDPNSTMVAPPGSSMHEKGLAVDLGPASEYGWLKAHGGQYGLVNYAPEPWHWEPRGASSAGNRTDYGVSGSAPTTGSGGINAGASTTGSFVSNMAMNAAGTGNYGVSQAGLAASLLGAPTEQGSSAYHYTGAAILTSFSGSPASAAAANGAGGGSGSGKIGPLPTGGDKRVPGHSITQWAHDLLTAMGINPSPVAMDAMIKWANHESGGYNPSAAGGLYNPLNSTESHYGYARNGGAQGNIKDYSSYSQGIQNLAWNLTQTKGAGYDKILAALRGSNEGSIFQAIDSSHFGTHGLGDPPVRGGAGGGGTIAMSSRSTPITANFYITPPASADGKKIAQAAFSELANLTRKAALRDS